MNDKSVLQIAPECAVARENVSNGDSVKPKSARGGKRPGAGRKPNIAKRLLKGFTRDTIALAIQDVDVGSVIVSLLKSKSQRTQLEALIFLRDTLHGRPAQNVSLSGGLVHAHTVWRPLADLSDEEMRTLDAIKKKLLPKSAQWASQNGAENQTESNGALIGGEMQKAAKNAQVIEAD